MAPGGIEKNMRRFLIREFARLRSALKGSIRNDHQESIVQPHDCF